MPVGLFSDPAALSNYEREFLRPGLQLLLTEPGRHLAHSLSPESENRLIVDITGPQLSRVNFDRVVTAILDLDARTLLSTPGRRLAEILQNLAREEGLLIALVGSESVHAGGSLLQDGAGRGLDLVPRTLLFAPLTERDELGALLQRISATDTRVLALDGSVAAIYSEAQDTVAVWGTGSALMLAFHRQSGADPVARLHALTHGMSSGWPTDETLAGPR